jgi:hypothetical protein
VNSPFSCERNAILTDTSYNMPDIADIDHPGSSYKVDLPETAYPATLVSTSFGIDNRVTFDMYGQPDIGGTVVVAVGSHQRTITVSATTGKVTISP